jgi:hypothetical protein
MRTPFRVPRLVLVVLLALVVIAEASTQVWYRAHETKSALMSQWSITWPTQATAFKEEAIAPAATELLRYNEGGGGNWSADGHNWNMYFFKWLPGRTAGLFIKNHRPEICLPASGMVQRGGIQYKLVTVNGVSLPMRSYVFESGGRPVHVFFCYWDGTPPEAMVDQEDWTAAGRLQAVKRGKRDVGTQTLELVAWDYDDPVKAEAAALDQLRQIIHRG